jgi:hypothetical protein
LHYLGLFVREKNIPAAIDYLSKELERRYADKIKKWDLDGIKDFIIEGRNRLEQSLKSFAKSYYQNEEKGSEFPIKDVEEEVKLEALEPVNLLISDVTRHIFLHGYIDQAAVEKFSKFTKVSKPMATGLIETLSNKDAAKDYLEDVKLILELFIRNSGSKNEICGDEYSENITKLMAVKKTSKPVYFKNQVTELLSKIVKNTGFESEFKSLTKQTQFRFSKFLAYYITSVMKNLMSPKGKK